jgi:hypothetical protein
MRCLVLNLAGLLPMPAYTCLFLFFLIISGLISLKIFPYYKKINKLGPQLATMANSLAWIEKASFQSALLKRLQSLMFLKQARFRLLYAAATIIKSLRCTT